MASSKDGGVQGKRSGRLPWEGAGHLYKPGTQSCSWEASELTCNLAHSPTTHMSSLSPTTSHCCPRQLQKEKYAPISPQPKAFQYLSPALN